MPKGTCSVSRIVVASKQLPQLYITSCQPFSVLPSLCPCHHHLCLLSGTPRPVCPSTLPSHTFHPSVCMSYILCVSVSCLYFPSLPPFPSRSPQPLPHASLCLRDSTFHPSPVLTASILLSPTQTARSLGLTWRSIPLWSLCV